MVYMTLVGMGPRPVLMIAQAAQIKRPTAYHVLESLREKKLVALSRFRGVKEYRALPLGSLKAFVRRQRRWAEKEVPSMAKEYATRSSKMRLRTYVGVPAVKTLLEKSLREHAALTVVGDIQHWKNVLGRYWEYFQKRSYQIGRSPILKEFQHPLTVMLWSDKVVLIDWAAPVRAIGFKHKAFSQWYRCLCLK